MTIAELAGDETSGEKSRTFVFENEGHTLGNALRSVVARYPEVVFCGYTIPHPAEKKMNFRIQTNGPKAIDVLKKGLNDLKLHCDHISKTFESAVDEFQKSRNLL